MPMPRSIDGSDETPKCQHGYWLHAYEKCPWCVGFTARTADVVPVVGPGNGWLLRRGQTPCMRCGGPGGSSSGLIPEWCTTEFYSEFSKHENLCFGCDTADHPLTPAEEAGLVNLFKLGPEGVPPAVRAAALARHAEFMKRTPSVEQVVNSYDAPPPEHPPRGERF